jgi:hypothetical protein
MAVKEQHVNNANPRKTFEYRKIPAPKCRWGIAGDVQNAPNEAFNPESLPGFRVPPRYTTATAHGRLVINP